MQEHAAEVAEGRQDAAALAAGHPPSRGWAAFAQGLHGPGGPGALGAVGAAEFLRRRFRQLQRQPVDVLKMLTEYMARNKVGASCEGSGTDAPSS